MRVHEHNIIISNNKEKALRVKELIKRREINMDTFFDKVFNELHNI
jgi:hypothetical protein